MPDSQIASAKRLRALVTYFALAFVGLLAADFALQQLGPLRSLRPVIVVAWMVVFPVGGWWVWRSNRGH